jgi:hypothetical protein
MFIVPKKDGGNRPVINLKPLNQFLVYEHFKMEGIHMLRDLLKQDDYLVKIDLKDAYLTVPIWKHHQKYLRFLWKGTQHEFICLPFGLATAPRVFTKLIKPVVAALRQRGIRLVIYLDDILIMAESQALAIHHAASTLNLLEGLGFIVNYKKSQLVPCQIKNRIFRFSNRFYQSNPAATRGKTSQNSKEMQKSFRQDRDFSSRIIKIPGPPNLLHSGHFLSTSPLQASSKAEEYYNDLRAFVRGSH